MPSAQPPTRAVVVAAAELCGKRRSVLYMHTHTHAYILMQRLAILESSKHCWTRSSCCQQTVGLRV
eukprot:11860-Heterococcus_DN1.PRE.2